MENEDLALFFIYSPHPFSPHPISLHSLIIFPFAECSCHNSAEISVQLHHYDYINATVS